MAVDYAVNISAQDKNRFVKKNDIHMKKEWYTHKSQTYSLVLKFLILK